MAERIAAAKGTWGVVDWGFNSARQMPAREFFLTLEQDDRDKVLALFQRLADTGRISNIQKFKSVEPGLWEFKSFQLRFLGDFRPGKRFVVATGLRKKRDALDKVDIATAHRVLAENDAVEKGGR